MGKEVNKMKSVTTYLEEIQADVETTTTKEELDDKYLQWCSNLGRDTVIFFPDIISNLEGQQWLRDVGENFAEIFNNRAKELDE